MKHSLADCVAIVRAFNNEFVQGQVQNLLAMGVGKVLVICDAERDGSDFDTVNLHLAKFRTDDRVQVDYIHENFSWSNALNAGLRIIKTENRISMLWTKERRWSFVFNVSVEAKFKADQVQAMLKELVMDPRLGVVGTTWDGRCKGNTKTLGWTYQRPRNTGSIWRIEVFDQVDFDPWCDYCLPVTVNNERKKLGGMEDFDAMIRAFVYGGFRAKMLDLKVQLIIGVNWEQSGKELREQNATRQILRRLRSQFKDGTSERNLIDRAIVELDLNIDG